MAEGIRQGDIPGVQLRCRSRLAMDLETAWESLVEPSRLAGWLCRRASMGASPDDDFEWDGSHEFGEGSVETGRVLAVEPPRRWVATLRQPEWAAATHLELELAADGEASTISVLQTGFEHLPLSQSLTVWEAYRRRWRSALERLARV